MPDTKIEVGQIWADAQKGQEGRTVRVESTDSSFVYTTVVTPTNNAFTDSTGRRSRVRIETFRRCYRLADR